MYLNFKYFVLKCLIKDKIYLKREAFEEYAKTLVYAKNSTLFEDSANARNISLSTLNKEEIEKCMVIGVSIC